MKSRENETRVKICVLNVMLAIQKNLPTIELALDNKGILARNLAI